MGRRVGMLVVLVAVFALLVWAGVHNHHRRQVEMQQAAAAGITVVKDDSAEAPNAQGASLRGKPAPAFTLVDTAGKKVSLADYKGKTVVVNFWATWCAPCKLEMPWFQEFSGKYAGQGVVILGLDQDDGMAKGELAAAAKKIGVSYPILLPEESVAKAYGGVDYLPETFYVTKAGTLVEATAGLRTKDEIEANIQKTLAAGGM